MNDSLTLYSFGFNDRSGKIRWLAHELGLTLEEKLIKPGEHRQYPFLDLNPYAAIPVVQWRAHTLVESAVICTLLSEHYSAQGLAVAATEADYPLYLHWRAVAETTLEAKLVDYHLAGHGLQPEQLRPLLEKSLAFKLNVVCEQLPKQGFLVADRLTVADIAIAYCLRLGLLSELISFEQVSGYLSGLMERPAANAAFFFDSIK